MTVLENPWKCDVKSIQLAEGQIYQYEYLVGSIMEPLKYIVYHEPPGVCHTEIEYRVNGQILDLEKSFGVIVAVTTTTDGE